MLSGNSSRYGNPRYTDYFFASPRLFCLGRLPLSSRPRVWESQEQGPSRQDGIWPKVEAVKMLRGVLKLPLPSRANLSAVVRRRSTSLVACNLRACESSHTDAGVYFPTQKQLV